MDPGCTSLINKVTASRTKGIVHEEKLESPFGFVISIFIKNDIESVKKGKHR